jgi:RimJ/RimL family protein N-acetyltransferase
VTGTARLTCEPISPAHLDEVWPWEADPRVARWMWPGHLGGPRTREQSLQVLQIFAAEWERNGLGFWLWREDGAAVARGGLRYTLLEDEPIVEVGWLVDPDRQGEGIATELGRASLAYGFDDRGFKEITARTLHDNRASRRVMEKLGMTYDGDIVHAGLPHVNYVIRPGVRT